MSNLDTWDRFADIDPKFTKPITGKPYKGTSPNPHYVIKCLTEMFGPVGVGFGWEVVAEGFQPMGEEMLHWCRIRFWHGDGKGFDAYGQTKAVMKTRSGLMNDEDAPKKSLTDAITKAAAQVGVGANIFLGRWDDNKYVAEVDAKFRDEERKKQPADDTSVNRIKAAIDKAADLAALGRLWNHPATNDAIAKMSDDAKADVIAAHGRREALLMQAPEGK